MGVVLSGLRRRRATWIGRRLRVRPDVRVMEKEGKMCRLTEGSLDRRVRRHLPEE